MTDCYLHSGGEQSAVEKEAALKDRDFAVTEQALEMERLKQARLTF